jgi:hypothetical protein
MSERVCTNRAIQLVIPYGNRTEHDSTKEPVVRRFHGLKGYCDMLADTACVPGP